MTPDKTIICKAVDDVLVSGCEIGAIVSVIRPMADGSCTMPAKINLIEDNGRIITLVPMGKPNRIQRRVFPRVVAESGVKLKLEFDNSNSMYKSMKVYDISGGGIGLTIYSKTPIHIGQRARLEIEFHMQKSKVTAHGEVVHSTLRNENSREHIIGIMFVQISEEDQGRVLEFVSDEIKRQNGDPQAHGAGTGTGRTTRPRRNEHPAPREDEEPQPDGVAYAC